MAVGFIVAPASLTRAADQKPEIAGAFGPAVSNLPAYGGSLAWVASVGVPQTAIVSTVIETSGQYGGNGRGDSFRLLTFTLGARFARTAGRNRMFVHILGGVAGESWQFRPLASGDRDHIYFTLQPGSGIDKPIQDRLAFRLGIDYLMVDPGFCQGSFE